MRKIVTVVGARPQFIKAAALNRVFKSHFSSEIEEIIVHTGQHYDESMSSVFFDELQIDQPKYHLAIGSAQHGEQTGKMMVALEEVMLQEKPDAVLVYGDTNSTLAGALVAAKLNVPVIHVEAGLRSFQRTMPEEINRIATDHLSTLLFSPTPYGVKHLKQEGIVSGIPPFSASNPGVFLVGDVMYDNALFYSTMEVNHPVVQKWKEERFVLCTIHRDHNTDVPEILIDILQTLTACAEESQTPVVIPAHPRLIKNVDRLRESHKWEVNSRWLVFTEPLSYVPMSQMERYAQLIVTDSGGVQKESYFAQKPCVILRPTTEWTEIIDAGRGMLVGSDPHQIRKAWNTFFHAQFSAWPSLYGSGDSAMKMAQEIHQFFA